MFLKDSNFLCCVQPKTLFININISRRTEYPDYMTHGIPVSCLIDSFPLVLREGASNSNPTCYSMASDGFFLYIHTSSGLYKVSAIFEAKYTNYFYQLVNDEHKSKDSLIFHKI